MVSMHSTVPFRPAETPKGPPTEPELERTKPESTTIQSGSPNMPLPADWDPTYAGAYAPTERIVEGLMGRRKRTKPESSGKQGGCKNISVAGSRGSVVSGWTTCCVAWWSIVCGPLLGRGNKLQVGPSTDHRKREANEAAM
jgi:hypothetical protein